MSITIRFASAADVPEVLDLWSVAARDGARPQEVAQIAPLLGNDPEALLVAVDGDVIVGSVIAGWDGWRCHI
jgi:predicted N-acetyltransferase YhbS